jgi:hypothetical protein
MYSSARTPFIRHSFHRTLVNTVIEVKGQQKSFSVDKLKPAFLLFSQPPVPAQAPTVIQLPARLPPAAPIALQEPEDRPEPVR